MTKAKGRHRREARVPEISGAPEVPEPTSVYEDTRAETYVVDLSQDDRIIVRDVRGSIGQVVDFVLTQEVLIDGEWHVVVRYDCAHGSVHVHRFKRGRRAPMVKKEICALDDIDEGYALAERTLFDGWEENRRRYFDGSRK